MCYNIYIILASRPTFGGNNMYKILHRLFHIPCAILMAIIVFTARTIIAMHNFWQNRKEDIIFFARKFVYAVALASVLLPAFLAICIIMIQLS